MLWYETGNKKQKRGTKRVKLQPQTWTKKKLSKKKASLLARIVAWFVELYLKLIVSLI